jgi:hypothetical protein
MRDEKGQQPGQCSFNAQRPTPNASQRDAPLSLDIYLQPNGNLPPRPGDGGEHIAAFPFENEGYYWFLCPLFEALRQETGENIDLYGDARFHGETLAALEQTLLEARALVSGQPDQWEVVIGIRPWEDPPEVCVTIQKAVMIGLLDTLEAATLRARETGAYITFWGD